MSGKMPTLTPIHVRGKRNAEHPRPSKKKRPLARRDHRAVNATSPSSTEPARKKRKVQLSRLEDLPTELLESVFLYSCNMDLPHVSRIIAAQLSGQLLQKQMMDAILNPVLLDMDNKPTESQLDVFDSMVSRRFCTWAVFRDWLLSSVPGCYLNRWLFSETEAGEDLIYQYITADKSIDLKPLGSDMPPWCFAQLVLSLLNGRSSRSWHVPSKLLHGPWTDDKLEFLEYYNCAIRWKLWSDAQECTRLSSFDGIREAIVAQSPRALEALLALGADPPPDFLQVAIIDEGCNREIVEILFRWMTDIRCPDRGEPPQRRLHWPKLETCKLDPTLWAWMAQPAQKGPGGNGAFVRSLLENLRSEDDVCRRRR